MKKKEDSFWSDIKALDERLTREPDSFCFARLSEIYLKVGLVADALHTARNGVAKHPGYLAGQRALAMACNAGNLQEESRVILEQVTAAMPEDVEAQKLLASHYVAVGDNDSAIRIYQTVLEFKPDDRESLAELEALPQGSSSLTPKPAQTDAVPRAVAEIAEISEISEISEIAEIAEIADEEEIIELSESDILEEPTVEEVPQVSPPVAAPSLAEHHDPLSTLTLAELYEKQGFVAKACEIYRTILADDPNNAQLRAKIAQLEGLEPVEENIPEETADSDFDEDLDFSEPETFDEIPAVLEAPAVEEVVEDSTDSFEPVIPAMEDVEEVSAPLGSPFFEPVSESMLAVDEPDFSISDVSEIEPASLESKDFAPLAHKAADNVVDTLDGWLENIRRIKACR